MRKLGKDTKYLLYGITMVFIISFLLVVGISYMLATNFQQELIVHDYAVAGYQLNHSNELEVSAFTAEKCPDDIMRGRIVLETLGYKETVAMELLPAVFSYRNYIMISIFLLLLFVFGIIYTLLFFYLYRQQKVISEAETSIRKFLDGDTMCRIESEQTGDWYSLFHQINELSSILSAHAEREKNTKEFLQNIISDISHQIKTPLAALKMYNEIIGSENADMDTRRSFFQKSTREIKRIEDVIYTLLKLARLDAGIIQMEKSQEDLSILIQDILERFEVWADREKKTIQFIRKENLTLYCDALWISEAIGNIVKNALEHTEAGGHITIRLEQTPLMTQIIIEDNGNGIHPDDLYNIFKRFYRSRFSQDIHGIGLGLPLAKSIVEIHGGAISVTSRLGIGTTFTLNFFNLTNK
jgi:Signal transduction histidine kinase